jgi:hypothetical protein
LQQAVLRLQRAVILALQHAVLRLQRAIILALQHAVLRLQRAIILALVFLIDFCYFETSENNRNNNGIFLMS